MLDKLAEVIPRNFYIQEIPAAAWRIGDMVRVHRQPMFIPWMHGWLHEYDMRIVEKIDGDKAIAVRYE